MNSESRLSSEKKSAASGRLEMLDAFRGLCCLLLVVFHTTMQSTRFHFRDQNEGVDDWSSALLWIAARTWIGVPIFFVISGYCITAALKARSRKGGVVEFAKRRFWRIYPPYWIGLAIATAAIFVFEPISPGIFSDGIFTVLLPWELNGAEWFGNLTLTESWRHCVMGGESRHLLPNTWTLCYEEQFYVVAGLILLFAPKRIFIAVCAVTVFALSGKVIGRLTGIDVEGSIFDGGWLLIAIGILLYYRVVSANAMQIRIINGVFLIGVFVHVLHPEELMTLEPNRTIERLVACSFALMISLLSSFDSQLMKSWIARPFQFFGKISYSVYLTHGLIVKGISLTLFRLGYTGEFETLFIITPICLVMSVSVGMVFYWLVERHFVPGSNDSKRESSGDSKELNANSDSMLAPAFFWRKPTSR